MSNHPARILIVDDDVDTCMNLADILSDRDFEVAVAQNGASALQLIRARPYDVALLDLKMPDMDGIALYREIRKLRSETVAIIITAYASSATAEQAVSAGAWQILPKPVDLPRLLAKVEEALGQPLILVIDDDAELCTNLWDILRDRGYRVGVACDEEDATEKLQNITYQVVLIDLKLPKGSGRSVLRVARQCCPKARAVIISGFRSELEAQLEQLRTEGAEAICYKPFNIPELLDILEKLSAIRR